MKIQQFKLTWVLGIFLFVAMPVDALCRYTNENGTSLTSADQTVKDAVTGLIWQRMQANITMNQTTANVYCNALSLNGFFFRLPIVRELSSLVNFNRSNPCIDPIAFPNTAANYFWSSTLYQPSPGNAWIVDFYYGDVNYNGLSSARYVRCVR